jgi:hypothetical protein
MRRLLILAGLLVVALTTSMGVTSAHATSSCTTTCSGSTLYCVPTGSCSSVPGTSITCDGVVTTCSAANPWCACANTCDVNLGNCNAGCSIRCGLCETAYNNCLHSCGTQPAHSFC